MSNENLHHLRPQHELIKIANHYHALGLSVIPTNESKEPVGTWVERQAPVDPNTQWGFCQPSFYSIGIMAGKVSGDIECIDIDCKYDLTGTLYEDYKNSIAEIDKELLNKMVIQKTINAGYHFIYKCETIEGNQKLASRPATEEEKLKKEKVKVLIETRGVGGYFMCAPSNGYEIVQGSFDSIPTITPEERDILLNSARRFNQIVESVREPKLSKINNDIPSTISPFEDFNQRGEILEYLLTAGWTETQRNTERVMLLRPNGKKKWSADYNLKIKLFYVFSSSTEFANDKAYTHSAVLAYIKFNKDFSATAKYLLANGFGEKTQSHNEKESAEQEALINELLNSSTLPDEIFESSPQLFKDGCSAFNDIRERDVFFTGAIIILSGCFPSISGIYDAKTVYANLYCYIIAPPASGKSALASAKALGNSYHKKLKKKSIDDRNIYEMELREYKANERNNKDATPAEPPVKPKFKTLFIPANSSSASMNDSIYSNDENGIICETEGATIVTTLKQDWGGYLDLLLKCFHHENISVKRMADKLYIDMDCPKLAVGITTTVEQSLGLISSAGDGLFSRFIHYAYHVIQEWRDVSPFSGRPSLDTHFAKLSEQVTKIIEIVNNRAIKFELTESQWKELNRLFAQRLNEITSLVGDEAGSSVKRLGLITFRIAMVLSIIRECTTEFEGEKIECQDIDFDIAIKLSDVYLRHAIIMYKRLPKGTHHQFSSKKRQKFYESLPKEFKRDQAVEVGASLKIPDRTVDHYLKIFLEKLLEKTDEYGGYRKINFNNL